MLNHVLVPLDRSSLAEKALPYAQHIVNSDGVISLMSVVEEHVDYVTTVTPGMVTGGVTPLPEAERQARRTQAEDYLGQVVSRLSRPHLQVEQYVNFGQPAEEIVDLARQLGVDAIVISTHGRTGISRWVYGSVTHKVLSATPCPVFVVPSRMPAEN